MVGGVRLVHHFPSVQYTVKEALALSRLHSLYFEFCYAFTATVDRAAHTAVAHGHANAAPHHCFMQEPGPVGACRAVGLVTGAAGMPRSSSVHRTACSRAATFGSDEFVTTS